jgi:hypothetical protein
MRHHWLVRKLGIAVPLFATLLLGQSEIRAGVCPGGNPLIDGWQDGEVGVTNGPGCASYDPATQAITVQGSGTGISGRDDQFHWVFQSISGDFELIARLDSISGGPAPYAGLIARGGASASTTNARFLVSHQSLNNNGVSFATNFRTYNGDLSSGGLGVTVPGFGRFHRIVRYKDQLVSYQSADGTNWVEGQTLNSLATSVYVGMMVTSQTNNGSLATAQFSQVILRSFSPLYPTSWFGNTYPGGSTYVPQDVSAMYVDPVNGRVFTNVYWDEGTSEAVLFDSNGNMERKLNDTHGAGRFGGFAITASPTAIYMAMVQKAPECTDGCPPTGTEWYAVRRYNMDGTPMPWTSGGGGVDNSLLIVDSVPAGTNSHLRGLAINRVSGPHLNKLYVSDTALGKIRIYKDNGTTISLIKDVAFTRPRGIAIDPTNSVVRIIQADDPATPLTNEAKIVKMSATGLISLVDDISFAGTTVAPTAVAVDNAGKIFVTDDGPNQRVLIYNANQTPATPASFGDLNGIYSGTIGQVQPTKLNGPMGIGVDNAGNLYIAADGPNVLAMGSSGLREQGTGAEIRRFGPAPSRTPQWFRHGLEFIDAADADPGTDGADVFTKDAHYAMDLTQPSGFEATYVGMTVDRFNYPDDMRLHTGEATGPSGVFIRRLSGQRIMYLTTQHSAYLGIYRFAAPSEIAIPCSVMNKEHRTDAWPPHQPASGRWIWHDSNNSNPPYNGLMEAGEYESDGPANSDIWGWYVDDAGDIWTSAMSYVDGESSIPGATPTIRRYILQGFDNGCPVYHSANVEKFGQPAGFTQILRALYIPGSDTMYIGGYTTAHPRLGDATEFGIVGREVRRYDNWHQCSSETNNICGATWSISDLPYEENKFKYAHAAASMDVAGTQLFIIIADTAEVRIYDLCSGVYRASRIPGPEVAGKSGWVDTRVGMNAFQRANGEYLVFAEDDLQAKQIFYRVLLSPAHCGPCQLQYCTGADIGCTWTSYGPGGCCIYQCGVELPGCTTSQCPPNVCGGC